MPPERPLKFLALACDYDGTLARDGVVDQVWIDALERLLASGRKLLLVTGRELGDLRSTFSRLDLFHRVVAENGAVLFRPDTGEEIDLAQGPGEEFVQLLRQRGVGPISVGRVIVATWTPHETVVLRGHPRSRPRAAGHLQQGRGDGAPLRRQQGDGLAAALLETRPVPAQAVGIGDAENDHAFLASLRVRRGRRQCAPGLQEQADLVAPEITARVSGADRPHDEERPGRSGPGSGATGFLESGPRTQRRDRSHYGPGREHPGGRHLGERKVDADHGLSWSGWSRHRLPVLLSSTRRGLRSSSRAAWCWGTRTARRASEEVLQILRDPAAECGREPDRARP